MTVAYRTNTAFDYRRYDEQEPAEAPVKPVSKVASRSVVMARRVLLTVVAVTVAAACIGLLYLKAIAFQAQRDINKLHTEIAAAQTLSRDLTEQYSEATNINTIKEKAAKLGMGYPKADQILYVPKEPGKAPVVMQKGK